MSPIRRSRAALVASVSAIASAVLFGVAAASAQTAGVARVGVVELKKLYDAGKVVVVDVRSAAAYRDGHVAGAVSMPPDAPAQVAAGLKASGKVLVTYCT